MLTILLSGYINKYVQNPTEEKQRCIEWSSQADVAHSD